MTFEEVKGFDNLLAVHKKRYEWATLSVEGKLGILEEIYAIMTKEMEFGDWKAYGRMTAEMMGYDVDNSDEGRFEEINQAFTMILMAHGEIEQLIYAFKVRAGLVKPPKEFTKGNLKTKKAINGQIVVSTFPILPQDKMGISNHLKSEMWLDKSKVQDASQVEVFAFDKAWEDAAGPNGGLMVTLGAGNYTALTFVDAIEALFKRNYVVYLKLHPIRNYTYDLFRRLFDPLISRGFFEMEAHTTNERCAALVYHPNVDAFHMTGGKPTHDLLVWGVDPEERERNLKANTPKLTNATSELGAVSPWVVVPGKYKSKELKGQASIIAMFLCLNASCSCNSPKCLVVAEDWEQKEEFLQYLEDALANHPLPVPYYPNIEKRWKMFLEQYPDCKQIESNVGMDIKERKLSPSGTNEKAFLLPYLKIEIDVDLDSELGRQTASKEFAFNNEPFAPMYTIATLKGTGASNQMKFATTASTFCNDYLFGTLSGSITSPPSLIEDDSVQTLIAEMKYGSVVVNNWNGIGYALNHAGMWGAFPGETLDAVESGIGRIGNSIAIPHLEKSVTISPIVHPNNFVLNADFKGERRKFEAVAKFVLYKGLGNFIDIIGAVIGVDLKMVGFISTTLAAVGAAAYCARDVV